MQTSVDSGPFAGARGYVHLSAPKPNRVGRLRAVGPVSLVTQDNLGPIARPRGGDDSFECLTYQLSMVL